MVLEESNFIRLSDKTFEKIVFNNHRPMVVYIGASWCGSCHIMSPILEGMAKALKNKVDFALLDIDTNERAALEYGLNELPILLFLKDNQPVDHSIGLVSRDVLQKKVSELTDGR